MQVEQIWKEKLNGASVLFLINRYATPLLFIIMIDGELNILNRRGVALSILVLAFQDPRWTRSVRHLPDWLLTPVIRSPFRYSGPGVSSHRILQGDS